MSTPSKEAIAREAAHAIWARQGSDQTEEQILKRVQSAIKKATEELQKANDNLFKVARKHCVENKRLKSGHPVLMCEQIEAAQPQPRKATPRGERSECEQGEGFCIHRGAASSDPGKEERGRPQEQWTHKNELLLDPNGFVICYCANASQAKTTSEKINAALAAEREKTEQATERYCLAVEAHADDKLQLLQAQAAIDYLRDRIKYLENRPAAQPQQRKATPRDECSEGTVDQIRAVNRYGHYVPPEEREALERKMASGAASSECKQCKGTGETTSGEDCGTCEGTGAASSDNLSGGPDTSTPDRSTGVQQEQKPATHSGAASSEDIDSSCSHPNLMLGCPDCGEWIGKASSEQMQGAASEHGVFRYGPGKKAASSEPRKISKPRFNLAMEQEYGEEERGRPQGQWTRGHERGRQQIMQDDRIIVDIGYDEPIHDKLSTIIDTHNAALDAERASVNDAIIDLIPQEFRQNSKGAVDCVRRLAKAYDDAEQGRAHYRELFEEIRQAVCDLTPTDATKKEIIDCVKSLRTQLLQAQAAIEDALKIAHTGINEGGTVSAALIYRTLENVSRAALREHDEKLTAEVRKPLVEALNKWKDAVKEDWPEVVRKIDSIIALAQVKEGK